MFYATNGYDLATGLGTPNGMGLINALFPAPGLLNQPASLNVTNGANVNFNLVAVGAPPLNFQWQLNGTNLFAGGNVSGVATNLLALTVATTNNSGSYRLIVSNGSGSITSSLAKWARMTQPPEYSRAGRWKSGSLNPSPARIFLAFGSFW